MTAASTVYIRLLLRAHALVVQGVPAKFFAHIPGASRLRRGIRSLFTNLLPRRREWVQVQSGFAKGLWIEIDLASERSWCAGGHELATQRALQQLATADTVVYDIGAHIGFYALPAARLGARVVAFEPDPENAGRLRRHVDRNRLQQKVDIVEAAAWSTSQTAISFRRGSPRSQGGVCCGNHRPVIGTGEFMEVPARSLDEFVASGGPAPHVIKIDVEGGESEVLQGASGILHDHCPDLVMEIHTVSECEAVNTIFERAHYRATWNVPPEGFPRHCLATSASPARCACDGHLTPAGHPPNSC